MEHYSHHTKDLVTTKEKVSLRIYFNTPKAAGGFREFPKEHRQVSMIL